LTLTGSNAGDNTFKPLIGNASDIGSATTEEAEEGFGTVGIRKTGAGKWILTNDNTYGGATNVEVGTLLVNGTHSGAGLTTVSAGATLGGTGSVAGGLTNNGTVALGASIGTFGVTGIVTMGENSTYAVELLGSTSDQLVVTGDIDLTALANTLNVTTLGALSGTSWVIATYTGALTGVFETITAGYAVDYGTGTSDVITLMLDEGGVLIGDYNNDGKVSAADYTVWRDHVGATTLTNRDPDNVGLVDDDDYNSWIEHFGETNLGSGAGAGFASASVPEPSSLLLGGLAILALFGFGRRRS
jgi:autotransporter-associated beta strand protein